jgi:hypothetical protein
MGEGGGKAHRVLVLKLSGDRKGDGLWKVEKIGRPVADSTRLRMQHGSKLLTREAADVGMPA